jgi:hypothetical protein
MNLKAIGIVAVGVVGFSVYDEFDKRSSYLPVGATVTTISQQCYMEKKERGVLTKTTSTSGMLSCDIAELLIREHPKWQGYSVRQKIEVAFTYVSPVDNAPHSSTLQLTAFPDGQPWREGQQVRLLASKTNSQKVRLT